MQERKYVLVQMGQSYAGSTFTKLRYAHSDPDSVTSYVDLLVRTEDVKDYRLGATAVFSY